MSDFQLDSRQDRVFRLIVRIALIAILGLIVYPLVYVVSASISAPMLVLEGKLLLFPKNVTMIAYERVFQNEDIWMGYKNTILYVTVGVTLNICLTIAGAYPLSRRDFFGRKLFMMLLVFTMFFSGGLIPLYLIVRGLGLINTFAVMVIPAAVNMFYLIILRNFFEHAIPLELQEAAMIDGSTNIGYLIKVVLPLSIPIIGVLILFYSVDQWNNFLRALMFLTDRDRYPLQLILREILVQSQMQDMMDGQSDSATTQMLMAETIKYAVIIVSSVPLLFIYPFFQRYFIKGIILGAIKG